MNKYFIYISVVLNGVLLMTLLGVVPFLLYLSTLFNLGIIWYVVSVIRKNSELEKDITEISEKIENFSDHLEEIHSLEVYYGDEDLQSLITHSRGLINDFIDFQASYFDVEVEEADEEED
jgi:hypothetical protein|tara:strand:- start:500 stop:859 length:360 start_codon:yes stop_codon:yes gene_type:complete